VERVATITAPSAAKQIGVHPRPFWESKVLRLSPMSLAVLTPDLDRESTQWQTWKPLNKQL
jgi:hypothetical protein